MVRTGEAGPHPAALHACRGPGKEGPTTGATDVTQSTTLANGLAVTWDAGVAGHLLWDGDGRLLGCAYDGNVARLVAAMGGSRDSAYVPPPAGPVAETIEGFDPGEVRRLADGMYLMETHAEGDSLLRDASHYTLATVFRGAAERLADLLGRHACHLSSPDGITNGS